MIADQTIGTAQNSRMIATPGVTNAQPANCSEATTLRRRVDPGGRPPPPPPPRPAPSGGKPPRLRPPRPRRSSASGTATSARGQDLVDLLRRGAQGRLRQIGRTSCRERAKIL